MQIALLFEGHRELRAVIDSALEGVAGTGRADDADSPRAARLTLGCYAIFGGDAAAPGAAALLADVAAPCEMILPDDDPSDWRGVVRATYGARLEDRPMESFDAARLDADALRRFAASADPEFRIERMDAAAAAQLGPDLAPHALEVFTNADDFTRRGLGFCAKHGDDVVCAATSYAMSERNVELAIATHPEFRRRGLARAVAAAFMAHALDTGRVPHWNAANPHSKRLAQALGYVPGGTVRALFLSH